MSNNYFDNTSKAEKVKHDVNRWGAKIPMFNSIPLAQDNWTQKKIIKIE